MKNYIYILFFLILLTSCKKDTTVKGQANYLNNGKPLAGYSVQLVQIETPQQPFSPLIIETIATAEIRSDGRFYFNEKLKEKSRYEYEVHFNDKGDLFAPESWEEESLGQVSGKVSIDPGQTNEVQINQVALSSVNYVVTNNRTEKAEIKIFTKSSLKQNRVFQNEVDGNDTYSYHQHQELPSGSIHFMATYSSENISDTLEQTIVLEHNEERDVAFVFD
ncbi:MAG: hypothetical protein Salg2KO_14720 [Salibacteraceae bacterium]